MRKETTRYRVYDAWDEFVVEGTARECAEGLGVAVKSFREMAAKFKNGKYKKYSIFEVQPEEVWKSDRDLAKQWDDFVTPIRERYGVPVYKPGKGDNK